MLVHTTRESSHALVIRDRGLAEIDGATIRQGESQARGGQAFIAVEQVLAVIPAQNRRTLRHQEMPSRGGVIDIRRDLRREIALDV